MTPLLSARDVSIRYHGTDRWILEDAALDQFSGKTTAIIGPSGCGKSSFIHALCGLIPHTIPSDYRGSIELDGVEMADASALHIAKNVAYVGQNPDAAVVTRSVLDEVRFPLQNLCLERDQIDIRARDALRVVGLGAELATDPWKLSGGQRQRLALATALAMRPRLLILDEPTSTIDSEGRRQFYDHLPKLVKQGLAVVVIDHDLDPLLSIVDHVIALDYKGALIAKGTPSEVYLGHRERLEQEGIWLPRALRQGRAPVAKAKKVANGQLICYETLQSAVGDTTRPARRLNGARQEMQGITCEQAGIKIPTLSDVCTNQVTYYSRLKTESVCGQNTVPLADQWIESEALIPTSESASPVLVARKLHVPGRSPALDIELRPGDLVALVGPNGSGKSTTLSALAGIERFEAERALVEGHRLKSSEYRVGYVFQNPEHQFVANTVERELSFGGVDQTTVDELLAQFHLEGHRDCHPLTLSGGQSRRLSVATMVGQKHSIVLLDEPTFGQDWAHTQELMHFISDLRDRGVAVMMATHDLELAFEWASHIIALPMHASSPSVIQTQSGENRSEIGQLGSDSGNSGGASGGEDAAGRRHGSWLALFNPFALFASVVLPILFLGHNHSVGVSLTIMAMMSLIIAISGTGWKGILGRLAGIWVIAGLVTVSMAPMVRDELRESIGAWPAASEMGVLLGAILSLILVAGLGTDPESVLRSATKYLHLPYRVAAAGTASLSFVRRFRNDFHLIRTARALRGVGAGWGILAPAVRWVDSIVPLIISAVRHGERVALSMDARAFGAYPSRTEMVEDHWRGRDTALIAVVWIATIVAWIYL